MMNNSDLTFSASINDQVTPQVAKIEQSLKKAGATPTEIKMFLRAYDEATPKIKEAQRQMEAMPKQQIVNIRANTDHVKEGMHSIQQEAKKPLTLTFKDNLDNIMQRVRGVANLGTLPLANALPGNIGMNLYWGLGAGALGGAGLAAGAAAKESFSSNAQMEQSLVTLNQTLKDTTKSQQEANKLISIAQKTPFNYQDLLSADVRLRSYQIPALPGEGGPKDPRTGKSQGWLSAAGNMAAALNTPITQSVEAIADARQGYFVRLQDYGIRLQREDFQKGGKYSGLTYEQGLERAIKRFDGSQEVQSRTLQGVMSNIKDFMTNQIARPVGGVPYNAVRQGALSLESKFNSDSFQREVGGAVEKVQRGFVTLFQNIQKGKQMFQANIQKPLEDIVMAITKFGTTVAKTFGGTAFTIVKTFGQVIGLLAGSVNKFVGSGIGESLVKWTTFFKALQFFGVSSADPFINLGKSLNPLTFSLRGVLGSILQLPGAIAKIGTLVLIQQFVNAKQAAQALNNQFKDMKEQNFDDLNAQIMNMAHGLDQSASGMQRLVTIAAQGVPKGVPHRDQIAVESARNAAAIQRDFGLKATDIIAAVNAEMKRTNEYSADAASKFAMDVKDAGTAAKGFGVSMKDLSRTLAEFGKAGAKVGISGYHGVPALQALVQGASATPLTHNQLSSGIYSGDALLQGALQLYGSPDIDSLRTVGRGNFSKFYNFKNTGIGNSGLAAYNNRNIVYDQNDQFASDTNRAIHKLAPMAKIPKTANPWNQENMGVNIQSIMNIEDPTKRAQKVFDAWSRNESLLDGIQGKVNKLTDALNHQNAVVQGYSQALDNVSLQLSQFEHTLVPIQRAIEDQSLAMEKYSFNALHPIERQMTRLNNAASEMSNTLQNAQYQMGKYSEGLLEGEQAVLDQLHGLEQYNKQLQLLQLLNQQLGSQLGSTTYERGYAATVKPMMGLTLAMQMQKNEREQQKKQLQYELSFGEQHYQLQQAQRTANQRREMSFDDRLAGIDKNVPIIDRMTVAQQKLGNTSFDLQQKMFGVNETLADQQDNLTGLQIKLQTMSQSPRMRALQDAQYNLQIATQKANLALQQQQITIDRWNATVDDLKTQGQDLGNLFKGMLDFSGTDPFEKARKMVEMLEKLPDTAGGISKQQGDAFLAQLNRMETAVDKAHKKQIDTSQSLWSQMKQGFLGLFNEDTWNIVAANIKKGLDGIVGPRIAGFLGGAVGVGGEVATITITAGIIGNLVRLAVGRTFNNFITRFGLAQKVFGGGASLMTRVASGAEQADLPKVAQFFSNRASGFDELLQGRKLGGTLQEALTGPFRAIRNIRMLMGGAGAGIAGTALFGPLGGLLAAPFGRSAGETTTFRDAFRGLREGIAGFVRGVAMFSAGIDRAQEFFRNSFVPKVEKIVAPIEKFSAALYRTVPGLEKFGQFLSSTRGGQFIQGFRAGGPELEAGAAVAGTGILSRLSSFSGLAREGSRFGRVGRITGLLTLAGLAFDAKDAFGATPGSKTQRGGEGSLIGTGIGGGLGFLFGGPGGAVVGSAIGAILGREIANGSPHIKKALAYIGESIVNGAKLIEKNAGKWIQGAFYGIGYALGWGIKEIGKGALALGKLFIEAMMAPFKWFADLFTGEGRTSLWTGIKSVASAFWDGIKWLGTAMLDGIKALFTGVWDGIKGLFSGIGRGLGFGHAGGIDYVPRDEYPARLHMGEAVLKSTDADEWRRLKRGGKMNAAIFGAAVTTPDKNSPTFTNSGRSIDIAADVSGGDTGVQPFLNHIRRTHKDIETIVKGHTDRVRDISDKARNTDDSNLQTHAQKQNKIVRSSAKSQTDAWAKQLAAQNKNADTGFGKTSGTIKSWTDKIDKNIKRTRNNLRGLNTDMKGPGGGGLLPTLDSAISGFQDARAQKRKLRGMSLDDLYKYRNKIENNIDVDHLKGAGKDEWKLLEHIIKLAEEGDNKHSRARNRHFDQHHDSRATGLPGGDSPTTDPTGSAAKFERWLREAGLSNKQATNLYRKGDPHNQLPAWVEAFFQTAGTPQDLEKKSKDAVDSIKRVTDNGRHDEKVSQMKHLQDLQTLNQNNWDWLGKALQTASDSMNKTQDDGFSTMYETTKGWIKKINTAVSSLGGPSLSTDPTTASGQRIGSQAASDIAAAVQAPFASGGLAKADPHKIGFGRLARINEEGHDEMIIPLAPHRRGRALSLLQQAHGMLGAGSMHAYANGGIAYVGDSLGVGTSPYLRGLTKEKITADVKVGRSSANGVAALRNILGHGEFDKIVFDLGTNDGSAGALSSSLSTAKRMAHGLPLYAFTVNGPMAGAKDEVLRHSSVNLVDWQRLGKKYLGPDHIHSTGTGYNYRAHLLASLFGRDATNPPIHAAGFAGSTNLDHVFMSRGLGGHLPAYANGGMSFGPGNTLPRSGMAPVADGQVMFPTLIPMARQILEKYKLRISAGWAPLGTHVGDSDHHWGGAADLEPRGGWGGPDAHLIRNLVKAVGREGGHHEVYPFRWAGWDGDVNHGWGKHLHLSWLKDFAMKGHLTSSQMHDIMAGGGAPGFGAAPSLDKVPTSLLRMGSVGRRLYRVLQAKKKKLKRALGGVGLAGIGAGSSLSGIPATGSQRAIITAAARKFGVPPGILWGIYGAETGFGHNVNTSSAGAQGPFQFMPGTADSYVPGGRKNIQNFRASAIGAAKYLHTLYGMFHNWSSAIGHYNSGPGGNLTNPETAAYIPRVLGYARNFAGGIRRVPFDGMPAILHQDERVLTAAEARSHNKKSESLDPDSQLQGAIKIWEQIRDDIHKSEKHLKDLKEKGDKAGVKSTTADLHDLNNKLRAQWANVAHATRKADQHFAQTIANTGDPSDGEATQAVIQHEKARRSGMIKKAVASVQRSRPYKAAVKAATRAKEKVKKLTTRARSAHSAGGKKITAGERKQIDAAKRRASRLAKKPKEMIAAAKKKADAKYVLDAAGRGVNARNVGAARGKALDKTQTKLYNQLIKAVQTGAKVGGKTADQLRKELTKQLTGARKEASGRGKEATKHAVEGKKIADSARKTSVKSNADIKKSAAEAKKQRDAATKEAKKGTSVADKADKKRDKADAANDKRDRDFQKKALEFLEKASKKDINVTINNTATGATIKSTVDKKRKAK